MRKARTIVLLLLIGLPTLLAAQDEYEDPNINSDWDYYYYDAVSRGDQTFIISLGTIFPIAFYNVGKKIDHKFDPAIGGTGSLAYNYYLFPKIFIGAEFGGLFIRTLGDNTLFNIFLGARGGYQFNIWRLEFPLTGVVGMVWHRYLDQGHYGLYLKGGGAAFFRASSRWSFGVSTNWYWLPQWTKDKSQTVYGNMVDITLCARYHF
ncbi:MAG: hypothetical protein LBQ93_10200 [Treponema sp.]|jgi:hypothetical protein|nr:hypothetical protein [Treponema sp.]